VTGIPDEGGTIGTGDLVLDRDAHTIRTGAGRRRSTPRIRSDGAVSLAAGAPFSPEEITESVWQPAYLPASRTLDVHIRRLRSKLDKSGEVDLQTVRGVGYRTGPPDRDAEPCGLRQKLPLLLAVTTPGACRIVALVAALVCAVTTLDCSKTTCHCRPTSLPPFCRRQSERSRSVPGQSGGAGEQAGAAAGLRLTLIAHDGTVLADSERIPPRSRNHAQRPEVKQALAAMKAVPGGNRPRWCNSRSTSPFPSREQRALVARGRAPQRRRPPASTACCPPPGGCHSSSGRFLLLPGLWWPFS